MGHFKAGPPEAFWKGLQQHMDYTDEELEIFKNDPKRSKWAAPMAGPDIQNSTLIFEVVESHGCANGMKPGDRLYFQGSGLLEPERSSKWCAHALLGVSGFSNICHNLILHGIDPNEMYADHFACLDCGTKYGWGQVIIKAYVIKEDKI